MFSVALHEVGGFWFSFAVPSRVEPRHHGQSFSATAMGSSACGAAPATVKRASRNPESAARLIVASIPGRGAGRITDRAVVHRPGGGRTAIEVPVEVDQR